MGKLAERLETIRVRATSHDGRIRAELKGRSRLSLEFLPGVYHRYTDESEVAGQLSRLATSVWVGFQRQYNEIISQHSVQVIRDPAQARENPVRRFLNERRELEGFGRSPGNCVKATTVELRQWDIRIRPGSLARLSERELITEVLHATVAARDDWTAKEHLLYRECRHPGVANAR